MNVEFRDEPPAEGDEQSQPMRNQIAQSPGRLISARQDQEGTQNMRVNPFVIAAMIAAMTPAAAMADDPHDQAMSNAEARARDREMIRQLNLAESARVRQRDARYAQVARAASDDYPARAQDHDRMMAKYARNRAQYEMEMAAWRRAVAACRAGDYSACGG